MSLSDNLWFSVDLLLDNGAFVNGLLDFIFYLFVTSIQECGWFL